MNGTPVADRVEVEYPDVTPISIPSEAQNLAQDQGGASHAQPLKTAPGGACSSSPVRPPLAQHDLSHDVLYIVSGTLRFCTKADVLALGDLIWHEMQWRLRGDAPLPTQRELIDARGLLLLKLQGSAPVEDGSFTWNIPASGDYVRRLSQNAQESLQRIIDGEKPPVHIADALNTVRIEITGPLGAQERCADVPELPEPEPHIVKLAETWKHACDRLELDGRDLDQQALATAFTQAHTHLGTRPIYNDTVAARLQLRRLAEPGSALAAVLDKDEPTEVTKSGGQE